jgi:hypothetical protein
MQPWGAAGDMDNNGGRARRPQSGPGAEPRENGQQGSPSDVTAQHDFRLQLRRKARWWRRGAVYPSGSYDFSAASAPTQKSTGLLISLVHLSLVILGCLGLVVEGRPGQGSRAGCWCCTASHRNERSDRSSGTTGHGGWVMAPFLRWISAVVLQFFADGRPSWRSAGFLGVSERQSDPSVSLVSPMWLPSLASSDPTTLVRQCWLATAGQGCGRRCDCCFGQGS